MADARLRVVCPSMNDTSSAPESTQETFVSHLVELRTRLLHAIIAVFVVLLCLFPWAKDIYALLAAPLVKALPSGATMIATDVTGTFLVPLKVTLMAAFLIALPYVLYQMWAFVAPGLYRHEKRLALPVIMSSVVSSLWACASRTSSCFRSPSDFSPATRRPACR